MTIGNFIGVHSSSVSGRKGTQKRYWFVWETGHEGYRAQALDKAFKPQGEIREIDPAAFAVGFSLEPTIMAAPLSYRAKWRDEGGEDPPATTTELEQHLRAYFSALLKQVRLGDDVPGAFKALQEIACRQEGIGPEHKFMFAEFGINLRKGKFPEAALEHAKRVLALAPDDGHAHFNIARIYYTLGKLQEAEQHLLTALEFAPNLQYARDFLAYIDKERKYGSDLKLHKESAR